MMGMMIAGMDGMMHGGSGMVQGLWMWGMGLVLGFWVLLWLALVLLAIVWLVRNLGSRPGSSTSGDSPPATES